MLCFLTRLYHYDDPILQQVEAEVDLTHVHKTFYKSFESAFCKSEAKVSVTINNAALLLDLRNLTCFAEKKGATKRTSLLPHAGLQEEEWSSVAVFYRALRVSLCGGKEKLQNRHTQHPHANSKKLLPTLFVSDDKLLPCALPLTNQLTRLPAE